MDIQVQVLVNPNTATFEEIENGRHFGSCYCPFCQAETVVLGPKSKGWGLAWIHNSCEHSQGIAAGSGLDITVLFRGQEVYNG
jgi:transposase-like protein